MAEFVGHKRSRGSVKAKFAQLRKMGVDGIPPGDSSGCAILGPNRKWNELELERYFEALSIYGRNYDKIAEHVGTRTSR